MAVYPVKSFWFLFKRAVHILFFQLCRFVFMFLQNIYWFLTGVRKQIRDSKDPANYDRCAQVVNLISWRKFGLARTFRLHNFIYTHDRFVNPEYVLQHDHVTMWFLDFSERVAVFSEAQEGQLVFRSTFTSIIPFSQLLFSRKLVIIPFEAYHKLAESLPDPGDKLVLLGNTSRCGSTLFEQMFEVTGKSVGLAEPSIAMNISYLYRKYGMTQEVLDHTRSCVKLQCKPLASFKEPLIYIIKPAGPLSEFLKPVREVFPESTMFYMYRDFNENAPLWYKMSWFFPYFRLTYLLLRFSARITQLLLNFMGFPKPLFIHTFQDDFTISIFHAIAFSDVHYKMENVHKILYNDMVKNPLEATRAIFSLVGLPDELVKKGVKAFDKDAHGNTAFNDRTQDLLPNLEVSAEDRKRGSALLTSHGFPPLQEEGICRLPGTLDFTPKEE